MSAATLKAVEDAIEAHFRDTMSEGASAERRGSIIVNWVVGYTISNVVNVPGHGPTMGYSNDYITADADPNAQRGLAEWLSEEIASAVNSPDDDDD